MNRWPPLDQPDLFHRFDQWDRLIAPALGEVEVKQEKLRRAVAKERDLRRTHPNYRQQKPWSINRQRVAEIRTLVLHRHGGPCDTDDAETYLEAALPHFVRLYNDAAALRTMVEAWTCTLLPGIRRDRIVALVEECRTRKWRPGGADEIAGRLRVTDAERTVLGLFTIGAIDCSKDQREVNRKKRDAEYQAEKRAMVGAKPRSVSNVARAKALGLTLSTFKRRLKAGLIAASEKTPDPISSALVRRTPFTTTNSAHPPIQSVEGPARPTRPRRSVGADGPTPSARTRAVPAGRAVPLPIDGVSEHPDLIDGLGQWRQVGAPLVAYEGGVLPPELARVVREALRVRMMTQEALANQVGVSRPQIGNVLRGRFGLSRSAASNLMRWLAA